MGLIKHVIGRRQLSQLRLTDFSGMTLLETLAAVLMLSFFTGVVSMVMEFTFRFLGEAEPGVRNESQGRMA